MGKRAYTVHTGMVRSNYITCIDYAVNILLGFVQLSTVPDGQIKGGKTKKVEEMYVSYFYCHLWTVFKRNKQMYLLQ